MSFSRQKRFGASEMRAATTSSSPKIRSEMICQKSRTLLKVCQTSLDFDLTNVNFGEKGNLGTSKLFNF